MNSKTQIARISEISSPDKYATAMGPFGSNIKKENYRPSGVPVIRGINLKSERFIDDEFVFLECAKAVELSRSSAFPEDIVFVAQGGIGQVGIIPKDAKYEKYILSQNLMKVTCDRSKAIPLYVFYFFRSYYGQAEIFKYQNQTGVPCISQPLTSLRSFEIPLPPLPTQKRIADILGTLDDKIELNRQMNRTLEAMARAIFKSWFVDFDPVYSKMEGRDYPLPAEVLDLFPDGLVESELGLIPKGWEVGKISDFGNVITGKTPSTKNPDYYESDDVPFLKIPDMHDQFFITETTNYLSKIGADSQKEKYIPSKSICVSCIATPGLVVMPNQQVQTNQQINSVIPKSELLSNFLLLGLKRKGDEIRLRSSGGSVFRNLNKSDFSKIQLVAPGTDLINYFNYIISPIFNKMINNQEQNYTLSGIRDILLPKLMNGEIVVHD